ncbi:MAG: alcohol dehydrogenase catalytic domain-containing protein, partial [Gammaproteobacteria bacterium]|nr:alcohol dehydrogenase catalytic domain-containing protein [Gammaproteobacteria bacterium]
MINAYAALEAGANLTPYQYDPGPLGEHEVEIEVRYCGICHSDISIIDNDWGMSSYPVVAGHEVVGIVSQLGAAVTNLSVGQTVGLGWYADYCETCEQCHNGDENICSDLTPTIVGHHGGFADKVRA